MITAFRGWNDGGQAATVAAGYLARQWEATRFADIDPEAFVDFQAVRPTVSLDEGMTRHIEWPENAFFHGPIPGTERDAVILLGVEPNYRWRAFTDLVVGLARELQVELVVTLGALLADVPHTRPAPVTGAATDPQLVEELGLQLSRYEGPTGIVGFSTTPAGRPSSARSASGRPCRTTSRSRRARRRRRHSACASRISSASTSRRPSSTRPRTSTRRR